MPQLPHSDTKEQKALSVEQLLRFKKAEQPDSAFWDEFDNKLHQRLFQKMVERQHGPIRRWVSAVAHSRITYAAMPAAAAMLVTISVAMRSGVPSAVIQVAQTPSSSVDFVVSVKAPALNRSAQSHETFVQDGLQMNMDNGHFRKVMAVGNPLIPAQSTSRYVADQLGSARNGILFASTSF